MDEEDVEREGCCCFPRRRRNNNSNNNEEEAKKGWCFNLSRNGRTIMMMDLREFCLTDWFIPVSIGFTIAINFDKTIEQFVSSWITPLVGILFGEHHDDLVFTVRGSRFTYGLFIDSLLNTSKFHIYVYILAYNVD